MAAEGKQLTSSQELGEVLGISPAQIRKDLSWFGGFGKQGTGYVVATLEDQLRRLLKVDRVWDVALVGVGNLGRAIAHSRGLVDRGFRVAALFDSDPAKIGTRIDQLVIQDAARLDDEIRARQIRVAMLAVPASHAQEVADRLVRAGIQAILCYAPTTLSVPPEVRVQYIDPVVHLQRMTYYLP